MTSTPGPLTSTDPSDDDNREVQEGGLPNNLGPSRKVLSPPDDLSTGSQVVIILTVIIGTVCCGLCMLNIAKVASALRYLWSCFGRYRLVG